MKRAGHGGRGRTADAPGGAVTRRRVPSGCRAYPRMWERRTIDFAPVFSCAVIVIFLSG